MSADHQPRGDDAAAFVLGALEPREANEFRSHLADCETCAAEVQRLAAAAAVLPLTAPQITAPGRLRRRVIAAAERQGKRARRPPWAFTRIELIGGGALAVGLAVGALLLAPGTPGTSVIHARVASAAAWHAQARPVAWLERSGDSAELVVENLPQPPPGEIYELWVKRGGRPRPTDALFEPTASGQADAVVPGGVRGASAVLVTAEPSGGSKVPTTAPLIDAGLQD